MITVTEILEAVKQLPEEQKAEFLDRLREIDFEDAWDRQIEADAKAGRLDSLWQQALKDITGASGSRAAGAHWLASTREPCIGSGSARTINTSGCSSHKRRD